MNEKIEIPVNPREIALVVSLVICVLIAIFVVVWAQEPDYRPLVQDIRLVDAVKIADILDQNSIPYKTQISSHMIFVAEDFNASARIALARSGIEIDYPRYERDHDITGFCASVVEGFEHPGEVPLWEQPWAMRALKLVMGGLVIIVLILAIVRPILAKLIYPEDEDI